MLAKLNDTVAERRLAPGELYREADVRADPVAQVGAPDEPACLHLRVGRAAAVRGRPRFRLLAWHNSKYRPAQNCPRVSCISE
jgi:hypothetical protein